MTPNKGGGVAGRRRQRAASSDMDESDEEDDRLEHLISNHQHRNVSDWSQGDKLSSGQESMDRNARRDSRRGMKRRKRRDEIESGDGRNPDESFEVDTIGTGFNGGLDVPIPTVSLTATTISSTKVNDGLLLPGHVAIQTEEEEAEARSINGNDEGNEDDISKGELGDFIRLDTDRVGQTSRYYEVEEDEQRKAFEECLTCGEKGHDKKSCPHLQCLACGALDEHSTRECPMGMSCFRCGGRGHKAFECKMKRTNGPQGWKECQRCGSSAHVETNCPTLWRIYFYHPHSDFKEERRIKFSESRTTERGNTRSSGGGGGGFEYRSESEDGEEEGEVESAVDPPATWDPAVRWCYNCAAGGNHWGDDCPLPRCNPTRPSGDPSSFSEYMASSGPFAHSLPPPPVPDQNAFRSGLRRGDNFDRFEAGPGASIHIYDPQREAMKSVDQLFDRYGPGASRRRDANRRRGGDREGDSSRSKPVDRKNGQGSKAQRYKEMDNDRESWSNPDYHRRDAKPSQVSTIESIALPQKDLSTEPPPSLEASSPEIEMTKFIPGPSTFKSPEFIMTQFVPGPSTSNDVLNEIAKLEAEKKTTSSITKKLTKSQRKEEIKEKARMQRIAKGLKKKKNIEMEAKQKALKLETERVKKAKTAENVAKAASAAEKKAMTDEEKKAKALKRAKQEEKEARKRELNMKKKEKNRAKEKIRFEQAQARRLEKGKEAEHAQKAIEWEAMEARWQARKNA